MHMHAYVLMCVQRMHAHVLMRSHTRQSNTRTPRYGYTLCACVTCIHAMLPYEDMHSMCGLMCVFRGTCVLCSENYDIGRACRVLIVHMF